jgi:5-(aminomethyl)-3-furanmethanol phosphate kinase
MRIPSDARTDMKPLVVKIGGSLEKSGRLRSILGVVARAERPVVLVPGGGVFADAVRAASIRLNLADDVAHRLAILAMHQMAFLMASIEPRLAAVSSLTDMRAACEADRVPVWLPLSLCQNDHDIPQDWSITSDGLAGRLAERLGGAALVLVKSCRNDTGADARDLADAGVVDAFFPRIVARANLNWCIVGSDEEGKLAGVLKAPATAV